MNKILRFVFKNNVSLLPYYLLQDANNISDAILIILNNQFQRWQKFVNCHNWRITESEMTIWSV